MTINIFALKGDLNEKIAVVRFFFCRVYLSSDTQAIIYMIIIWGECKLFEFLEKILRAESFR